MDKLEELREYVRAFGTAPTLAAMPRRTLAAKGINGPTGAHVIEELHTPLNLAYVTATTGTTAFQNLVGVTAAELPARVEAARKALAVAGLGAGARLLVTYPPLVNVFPAQALAACGISWEFLEASSRDALVLALCEGMFDAVLGESSFLRAALADTAKLGLVERLPSGMRFIAAGTPLDPDLAETATALCGGTVHDLYGCQEFGWLALDGMPLREDIALLPTDVAGEYDLLAGGLPTGDRFPVDEAGRILTHARRRVAAEPEVTLLATTATGLDTAQRLCKTVLRIKAKILRCAPGIRLGAEKTVLCIHRPGLPEYRLEEKTGLLDSLLQAQLALQSRAKQDPAWNKEG